MGKNNNGKVYDELACRIKTLPARLRTTAAEVAARINPVNAPLRELRSGSGLVDPPDHLTLLTTKWWGPNPRRFTVSFLESAPADLRARILSHMNAWSASCGMTFVETTDVGEIRISRGPGGYSSYLGTDNMLIPASRETMNLQGFTMQHPEGEFRRVVRHEVGHALGFPHEHLRSELVSRIDPVKAYPYFLATQGWSREMVDQQVLTPLNDANIFGTPADQDSIMCYQVPGSITFDGQPIRGGLDINTSDYAFAALIYPRQFPAPGEGDAVTSYEDDWDQAEDVTVPV